MQHLLIVTAVNFLRVSEWLGEPLEVKTRRAAFIKLMTPRASI